MTGRHPHNIAAAALLTAILCAAGARPAGAVATAAPAPGQANWRQYVLSPASRDVHPVAVAMQANNAGTIIGDPTAAMINGSGSVDMVSAGLRATSPTITLDFGREVGGNVRVLVTAASAVPPGLHACFSESLHYAAGLQGATNNGENTMAPGCDTANYPNGFPGTTYTYDSDSHTLPLSGATLPATLRDPQLRGGFRYLTFFLDAPGTVSLSTVDVDFTAAPGQAQLDAYRGWFASSDDVLNHVWYSGAYTVQLDTASSGTAKSWPYKNGEADHADAQVPGLVPSQEVIFDGAKRDRIVWEGDLSVQAPVTWLSTGDGAAVDNSLASLAAQQLSDGYVPAESLVGPHNVGEIRTYGEYVDWFINNHYQHLLYTGDLTFLQTWYAALTRATAWLESVRAKDAQGLIAFGTAGSCGHYGYSDCGHETYLNALYAQNLDQMSAMAAAAGDSAAAQTYSTRAQTVKNAINAQLWDSTVGAYRLSRESPNAYPQDANAAAVLAGVASAQQASQALAYLRANNWGTYGSLTMSPSTPVSALPSFYAPVPSALEAEARLGRPGESQSGVDLIRLFWGYQLTQDPKSTWFEHLTAAGALNLAQFSSLAHGWGAGPTIALTTQLLGVQPSGAGFSTWTVTPHPADVAWSQGSVPTPNGGLGVSWQQATDSGFTVTVSAPPATSGAVSVPLLGSPRQITEDGQLVWDGSQPVGGVSAVSDGTYVRFEGATGTHTWAWGAVPQTGVPEAPWVALMPLTAIAAGMIIGAARSRPQRRRRTT